MSGLEAIRSSCHSSRSFAPSFLGSFFRLSRLSQALSFAPLFGGAKSGSARGGDKRDRTVDLLLAKQALSQLSYTPNYLVVHSGVLPSFISS